MDRVIPRLNNAFDYVVQHGKALAASGAGFDSCQREAITHGTIRLDDYRIVLWAAGKQTSSIFTEDEQRALSAFLARGGNLFVSGSHIAEALRHSEDLGHQFHACPRDDVTFLCVLAARPSAFHCQEPAIFGDGSDQSYFVDTASCLVPEGPGARSCLSYPDGESVAAVQYNGSAGGGKVVCFGFPFECISSAKMRARYMEDILRFFASGKGR